MDIALIVKLRDKIERWVEETNDDWYPIVYYGEDLVENMVKGAVAVFDMSVSTAKYYEEKVYPDVEEK